MANLFANLTFSDEDEGVSVQKEAVEEKADIKQISEEKPVSKTQLKKRAKLAKKLELRKGKRQLEKIRRRTKRAKLREEGIELLPKKKQTYLMGDSKCKVRVVVDMAYEKLMTESCIRKTLSQLNFCYAANRRARNPLQFYVVNLRDQSKFIFDNLPGYVKWDAFILEDSLSELWRKEEIVYLSSESENVLSSLEPEKAYVIGGLVDHNSQKGLCHSEAIAQGFSHARLPIDEFVKMKTRKVLTINQVFEILLHFSEFNNWEDAFFSVIPKRKGVERLEATSQEAEVNIECSVQ